MGVSLGVGKKEVKVTVGVERLELLSKLALVKKPVDVASSTSTAKIPPQGTLCGPEMGRCCSHPSYIILPEDTNKCMPVSLKGIL